LYTSNEVTRILNLSDSELRRCLRAALFPPLTKRRPLRFSFQDLLLLKTTKGLCEAKIPVSRIRRILDSLKRQLPEDQQLSNVKIYADGHRVVVWDGTARWQPDSGQFLFNFEPETKARVQPVRPQHAVPTRTAEQWVTLAMELEDHSPEEARHAYREALRLDPGLVDAHINLGFLYHADCDLTHAEACYRAAIRYAPREVLGHFNLAVVLEEKGDRVGAIEQYQDVLRLQPAFAEAHYNLGTLYEAEGRKTEAIQHYAAAKKLLGGRRGRSRLKISRPTPPGSH
jgi:tetratricopeptide (TPR) repeat protein